MRRRPAASAALLSLLTAVASLSTEVPHTQRARRRSLAVRKAVTLAVEPRRQDVLAEVTTRKGTGSARLRRAGRPGEGLRRPPMVDSDLLRFLSQQKKRRRRQNAPQSIRRRNRSSSQLNFDSDKALERTYQRICSPTFGYLESIGFDPTLDGPPIVPLPSPTHGYLWSLTEYDDGTAVVEVEASPESGESYDVISAEETPSSSPPDVFLDASNRWMTQYNRHAVASVLQSQDSQLDPDLAERAGEQVQACALSRTARRRVREFLKQRDSLWTSPTMEPEQQSQLQSLPPPSFSTTILDSTASASSVGGVSQTVEVLLGYGLTVKDIAEILIHTPSVALMRPRQPTDTVEDSNEGGESLTETVDRALVRVLSGTLGLRKYDARKVLRSCPGLFTMRGSKSAESVVELLQRLGVSANSIARDKTALPTLLSRPPASIFRLVAFLSSDAVRMPVTKIGPLLRRCECQDLLDAVAPIPRLQNGSDNNQPVDSTDLNGDESLEEQVLSVLSGRSTSSQSRRDQINDTYQSMSKTAWTLRHKIGTADLSKVIAAYPSVLLLDAEEQILPTAQYLMEDLGLWKDDLPRVLQLYPVLLGMEVSQMKLVESYLLDLEISPASLTSILRSFPALLTLDVEANMMPVVDYLRSSIGISNAGRFISRLPPILGYSVENEIKPKWELLQSIATSARFELTRFPAYFSYPLERVKARYEYLRKVKRVPTQLLGLDQILRFGDKDFAVKVAGDKDHGEAFRNFVNDRKSHTSKTNGKRRRRRRPKK